MPSPTLPPRSLMPLQSAPALRYGARRRIKCLPPPRFHRCAALVANHELLHLLSCGGSAVLAATHAADDRQSRSWAQAPAAISAGQLRCGAASASKAADPWLMRAV